MITNNQTKGPRISLVSVFSLGVAVILLVFVLLSYFTFTRLLSFESTLTEVSDKALPDLIVSNQLYSQSARLLESAELLSSSTSRASKRLAEKQLSANLADIRSTTKKIFDNEFLDTQLSTIAIELSEFSELIKKRLEIRESIEELERQLYDLNNQAAQLKTQLISEWEFGFSQALVGVGRALNAKRLQQVRYLFNQLNKQIDQLDSATKDQGNVTLKRKLIDDLNRLLFSEDGLEALKILSLRVEGRAIGRENFVHNLIDDYVAQLRYVTQETEQKITQQVASSVVDMKEQTGLIRSILIGGIIVLLVIMVLFQQRILKRLSIINYMVRRQTQGHRSNHVLHGNDEITDLLDAFSEFTFTIEKQKEKLEKLSMSDGLTGIANRRALDIRLKHDIELSLRQKSHVAVLLMDIDCFKLYNDNYGHAAGDECLKEVAKVVSKSLLRDSDFSARYGGEEFICVLPNTDAKGAEEIAKHIFDNLTKRALPHAHSDIANIVTLSMGIAVSRPDYTLTPDIIIRYADKALYAAKKAGKNTLKLHLTTS